MLALLAVHRRDVQRAKSARAFRSRLVGCRYRYSGKIAACGDRGFKVLVRQHGNLEVLAPPTNSRQLPTTTTTWCVRSVQRDRTDAPAPSFSRHRRCSPT